MRFIAEAVAQKQHAAAGKISLRFDSRKAIRLQGMLVVTVHNIVMPGQEAVTDLVGFVPAVLEDGQILVKQDPLLVGQIEGLKA